MGGYGSTRWGWYSKKTTVEESLPLDLGYMIRTDMIWRSTLNKPYTEQYGYLSWTDGSMARYWVTTDAVEAEMRLEYTVRLRTGKPFLVETTIPMTTTPLHFGGVRWWFQCPNCSKRYGKLWKPPESDYFRCRICHSLTYNSSQSTHEYRSFPFAETFDLLMKMEKLFDRIMRCRAGSKNFQRLMARYERIEEKIARYRQEEAENYQSVLDRVTKM